MSAKWISLEVRGKMVKAMRRDLPSTGDPGDVRCRRKECDSECRALADWTQFGFSGIDQVKTFFECPSCGMVYFVEYEVEYDE